MATHRNIPPKPAQGSGLNHPDKDEQEALKESEEQTVSKPGGFKKTILMTQPTRMRRSREPAASCGRRVSFRDVGTLVTKSVSAWLEHNASSMGASLAFYTLFSIAAEAVHNLLSSAHYSEKKGLVAE